VTETEVCIHSPHTVCPVEKAQVAAPAAAPRSERFRPRKKKYAARYAKLNLRNRIPVSIHASGRRSDGSATNGERKPCARWNGPTAPDEIHGFQKKPRGKSRYRTSVVSPDAAGSARSGFSD
jgi:hypothetical protein